tara:strand:- start:2901 stop:3488 length:588 start_codon:yes stop_codon:yes gene_type:complete
MLHSVNLLPWREQLRDRHKHRFLSMLAIGIIIAVGIQWAAASYLQQQTQSQQARLNYLNSYIAQLDKRINDLKQVEQEHKALLTRLSVVEKLQNHRNKTTDFMNALPLLIPEGVYVDKIKMNGLQVRVSGISDTTSRLATMLDNLESSTHIRNVEMHSIVHDKPRFGKKFQTFNVSFSFVVPRPLANLEGDKQDG